MTLNPFTLHNSIKLLPRLSSEADSDSICHILMTLVTNKVTFRLVKWQKVGYSLPSTFMVVLKLISLFHGAFVQLAWTNVTVSYIAVAGLP